MYLLMCLVDCIYRGVSVHSSTALTTNAEYDRASTREFTVWTSIAEERPLTMLFHAVQSPR